MARSGVGVWCAGRLEPSSGRRLGAGILRGSGPVCFDEEPRHKEREAMALEEQVLTGMVLYWWVVFVLWATGRSWE